MKFVFVLGNNEICDEICVRVRNFGEFDRSKSRSRRSFEPLRSAFGSIKVVNSQHEHKTPYPNTKVTDWSPSSVCHMKLETLTLKHQTRIPKRSALRHYSKT